MSDRLERLYERALTLPETARAAFLAEACEGDEKLHAELLSLLSAADAAERFFVELGHAVFAPPTASGASDGPEAPDSQSRPSRQQSSLREGSVVDHYRIVGRIGVGGMGTVYRAHDTRLDREVALKFPAQHLRGDEDARQAFLVEARAAAALQHPNICVVHEIGTTPDGQPFIAMALCEGDTLKQRLAAGPIEPEEALAIASQVARALSAAHSRHVIHRDVKPGNIILAIDGTVKLLDFGLAKSSDGTVTLPGSTPGTIAYMSPEQVRGESLDHRTDLWSLGVVFYEMLTGRRPFRGGNDRVVLQAILHDDPEPLSGLRPDVPSGVAHMVHRLLRKDRDGRYTSAEELLGNLAEATPRGERIKSQAGQPATKRRAFVLAGITAALLTLVALAMWSRDRAATRSAVTADRRADPSIAVLPLVNLSGDSGDAVLAAGITEELIATLARAGGVRVIASSSSSAFRNRELDIRRVADSLGVSNILDGGIQKKGSRLRVQVRLVAATDGSIRWSQVYDRDFQDLFSVQDEIARAVAGELELRFDKDRQLRRHHPRNVAAYELYLRGWDPVLLRSESGLWKSQAYFEQAIAADPTYAAAHAGLALRHVLRGQTASDPGMPLRNLFTLAEAIARKAVALDDSLPEAHYALARVLAARLEFSSAEAEIRRAIALDPTRSVYRRWLSSLHIWAGRPEAGLTEARRALETDPLNPYAHMEVARSLFGTRRYDEALAQLQPIAMFQPPLQGVAFTIAECYAKKGMLADAIAILRPQAAAGDPLFRALLGHMLAQAGQRDEANELLADMVARHERTGGGAFHVAVVYAGLGDFDETFAWLNKSVDDWSIHSWIMGPTFEDLHRDPRFEQLKSRLKLQKR